MEEKSLPTIEWDQYERWYILWNGLKHDAINLNEAKRLRKKIIKDNNLCTSEMKKTGQC